MSSEPREVLVDVYVNGVFYCTDSFWASDDQDVESEITSAIYDHFNCYKPENIHVQLEEVFCEKKDVQLDEVSCEEKDVQLEEVSCEEKDVQLEVDVNDAISESVSLVSEELTDPVGSSTEVEGSISEIDQEGMDVSSETSEENIPTEFAKVRKTISEFFRTGISPQSKTDLAVSESLCEEAGSSSEISQGGVVDASSEISEEDIPIDFAKVRRTISEFFRTGISAQPKTDLAVSELLCKVAGSSSEIGQGGLDASFDISEEDIPKEYAKVRKTISAFFQKRCEISAQLDPDVSESLCVPPANAPEPTSEPLSSTPEPMEPEPYLVDPEEWSILSSSEPEPVSSEGLVVAISDAISELRSPTLMSKDLTDPEGPSTEVAGSSSGNDQGGSDASPETPEEDIPTEYVKVRRTISEFFRTGISAQPKTDLAVSEFLCKVAGSSSEIGQGGLDASFDISEEDIPIEYAKVRKTISAFFQKRCEISAQLDPDVSESLCVPPANAPEPTSEPLSSTPEPMEPEPYLVDPEEWSILSSSEPEPVSSEGLVVAISDAISELRSPTLVSKDLTDPEGPSTEVAGSSSGNDQGGSDASPETPEEDIPTEYVKVRKINKISKFFQKLFGISAQPQKDPAVPEPPCIPEANVPEQEPQVTELSVLETYIPLNIFQLKKRLEECTLSETPVTEIWPNIFLGNEETARDRTKLKEMGITHILNAAAVKKKLRGLLMGMPKEKDLNGKVNTGKKYYRGMNIKYCGLPTTHRDGLNMGMYFLPAAKFIHKALRNPENKVLIHCCDGVSHSPTLFLAYLMIHREMMVEESIDCVIKVRHIKPSMSILTQLMSLNAELVEQRKQQLQGNQAAKCR